MKIGVERTLSIGLDGCSWNVLDPLLATGELPNLGSLRMEGAAGVLESTVPFFTGPAWSSYATGSSPLAHGIYDFMMLRDDGSLSVANQGDLRRKPYYQQLGEEGRRSVLINLPLDQFGSEGTVIVNSWLTDDEARRILPVGRRDRYARLLAAYRTFPADPANLEELLAIEQARFDLARELFLAEEWDHFFVLFSSTDWLGHQGTGLFLSGDESAKAAFLRLYKQLDGHIGWFLDHAPDAHTFVLSDHGQTEERTVLRVNTLLDELGLIERREPLAPGSDPFFVSRRKNRLTIPRAFGRARSLPVVGPLGRGARDLVRRRLGVDVAVAATPVDRTRSRAFTPTDASFAVYTSGDDVDVDAIRDALLSVTLPDGRAALDGVFTPEELYGRAPNGQGPALLFSPALGVRPTAALKDGVLGRPKAAGRGCHQRDGMILVAGPETQTGDLGTVSIMDVAPTLLWSMGCGIPEGGDGRVLFEAFEPTFTASIPRIEVSGGDIEPVGELNGGSDEVTERLRALGYI